MSRPGKDLTDNAIRDGSALGWRERFEFVEAREIFEICHEKPISKQFFSYLR